MVAEEKSVCAANCSNHYTNGTLILMMFGKLHLTKRLQKNHIVHWVGANVTDRGTPACRSHPGGNVTAWNCTRHQSQKIIVGVCWERKRTIVRMVAEEKSVCAANCSNHYTNGTLNLMMFGKLHLTKRLHKEIISCMESRPVWRIGALQRLKLHSPPAPKNHSRRLPIMIANHRPHSSRGNKQESPCFART